MRTPLHGLALPPLTVPRLTLSALMLVALTLPAPGAALAQSVQAPIPPGYEASLETERFLVLAEPGEADRAQLEGAGREAERFRTDLERLLGEERAPGVKLIVVLGGSGLRADGSWNVPHVDRYGRIFLYRYRDVFEDHFNSLAHEMVHALRRAGGHRYTGFVEEGLATVLAAEVDPGGVRFPTYGYSLDLVAGHLLAGGEAIPLDQLRRRHGRLNTQCQFQAYAERASFFAHLRDRYGLERVIELVYGPAATDERWAALFDESFDSLAEEWAAELLDRYRAIPDREDAARRYRTETPIQRQPVCVAGEHF
jgi:hypothetical protein